MFFVYQHFTILIWKHMFLCPGNMFTFSLLMPSNRTCSLTFCFDYKILLKTATTIPTAVIIWLKHQLKTSQHISHAKGKHKNQIQKNKREKRTSTTTDTRCFAFVIKTNRGLKKIIKKKRTKQANKIKT